MALAERWSQDASREILDFIWRGFDRFREEILLHVALDGVRWDERELVQSLAMSIDAEMSGFAPFLIQHEAWEFDSRKAPSSRPPQSDIGFCSRRNHRILWPVEAKLLPNASDLGEYVSDLRDNMLTGRYGPYSTEGAMVGFLVAGEPGVVFGAISHALGTDLEPYEAFASRPHQYSEHEREKGKGGVGVSIFRCHHLVLGLMRNLN